MKSSKNRILPPLLPAVGQCVEPEHWYVAVKRENWGPVLAAVWLPYLDEDLIPSSLIRANQDGSVTVFCGGMERENLQRKIPNSKRADVARMRFLDPERVRALRDVIAGSRGVSGKSALERAA